MGKVRARSRAKSRAKDESREESVELCRIRKLRRVSVMDRSVMGKLNPVPTGRAEPFRDRAELGAWRLPPAPFCFVYRNGQLQSRKACLLVQVRPADRVTNSFAKLRRSAQLGAQLCRLGTKPGLGLSIAQGLSCCPQWPTNCM